MSLARDLTDLIVDVSAKHGGPRVSAAIVEIGDLACVDPQTLDFAFQLTTKGTCAEGCQLLVRRAPLVVRCNACDREGEASLEKPGCPHCGAPGVKVVSGRQMKLVSIDVEDAPPAAPERRDA